MIQNTRFVVLGAPTMMELVALMNEGVHPLAQLKYFGPNGGDYTGYPEQDKLEKAKFIALFDAMPTPIADMGEMQIITSLDEVSNESDIAMSA